MNFNLQLNNDIFACALQAFFNWMRLNIVFDTDDETTDPIETDQNVPEPRNASHYNLRSRNNNTNGIRFWGWLSANRQKVAAVAGVAAAAGLWYYLGTTGNNIRQTGDNNIASTRSQGVTNARAQDSAIMPQINSNYNRGGTHTNNPTVNVNRQMVYTNVDSETFRQQYTAGYQTMTQDDYQLGDTSRQNDETFRIPAQHAPQQQEQGMRIDRSNGRPVLRIPVRQMLRVGRQGAGKAVKILNPFNFLFRRNPVSFCKIPSLEVK